MCRFPEPGKENTHNPQTGYYISYSQIACYVVYTGRCCFSITFRNYSTGLSYSSFCETRGHICLTFAYIHASSHRSIIINQYVRFLLFRADDVCLSSFNLIMLGWNQMSQRLLIIKLLIIRLLIITVWNFTEYVNLYTCYFFQYIQTLKPYWECNVNVFSWYLSQWIYRVSENCQYAYTTCNTIEIVTVSLYLHLHDGWADLGVQKRLKLLIIIGVVLGATSYIKRSPLSCSLPYQSHYAYAAYICKLMQIIILFTARRAAGRASGAAAGIAAQVFPAG